MWALKSKCLTRCHYDNIGNSLLPYPYGDVIFWCRQLYHRLFTIWPLNFFFGILDFQYDFTTQKLMFFSLLGSWGISNIRTIHLSLFITSNCYLYCIKTYFKIANTPNLFSTSSFRSKTLNLRLIMNDSIYPRF